MNPVIRRLQNTLFANYSLGIDDPNPENWTFSESIQLLGVDFYRAIIPSHLILNMEYSLLGQQIRTNLDKKLISEQQLAEQIISAIFLAELLEQVYQKYLIVPREVERLRTQKQLYREILIELKHPLPKHLSDENKKIEVGLSFSQEVRQRTLNINLYRLLLVRSKRALDLIAALDCSADWYRHIMRDFGRCTDPFLPHLAFLFYAPRLAVNLGLLMKHLLPGSWMEQPERDLGWKVRLQGQLLRRWFELGNDIAWVGLGYVNGYLLTGAFAPVAAYLSIAFFGYDVALAAIRAYIELNRVYEMRSQYQKMLDRAENEVEREEIKQQLRVLDQQINFELLRFSSHVAATTAIFLAMGCGAPLFAANPAIALAGAICLVVICLINFALVPVLNQCRPRDIIEVPTGGIAKLGFFAKKEEPSDSLVVDEENTLDDYHSKV
ncbi:MAG: hypothetical protein P4L79_16605 [Legionella sp.]|uniref:hypothetical protein n=1 Tax=Legionella sp. TaxID=459 RepID=UPI0028407000|nr:hypothetical protein [Legionella sp.]